MYTLRASYKNIEVKKAMFLFTCKAFIKIILDYHFYNDDSCYFAVITNKGESKQYYIEEEFYKGQKNIFVYEIN